MFYKIDSTRLSFREYWWGCRNPTVLIAWLVKVLRIRLPCSSDDPNVFELRPFQVPELPENVREQFEPLVAELTALGFHSPICHVFNDPSHLTRICWMTFCHSSGRGFARIHHRVWTQPHPPRIYLFPIFITPFRDGGFLVSSAGKADMASPPNVGVNRRVGASGTDLWRSHEQALASQSETGSPVQILDPSQLVHAAEQFHTVVRDFHLHRKAFVPLDAQEMQALATQAEQLQAAEANGVEHAEVLAELNRQQTRKKGWGTAVVILLISMVLFMAAGAAQWSLGFVALLIPILLFHELGHYVAMRIFKYRNLRMFFIPFFGAAVTGQHFNVAGWKKVIVSLMGPLPGILVGIGLGAAGMLTEQPPLIKAAVVTLILNGFNLLPVLPLDGGWVMHALFFSRHYMLDFAFRCVAAAALIVGSFVLGDRILLFVGIPLAITLPIAFKMARIANGLRSRGLPPALPNDSNIPVQTAQAIIGEVKKAFPKGLNNKSIAQYTAQIFETLNSRPPGWLATLGLLTVYGASLGLAAVFSFVFVIAEHGDVGGFLKAAAAQPKYSVACNEVETWGTAGYGDNPAQPRVSIVATYSRKAEVNNAFQSRASALRGGGSITRFGSSLLISLPASDREAMNDWEAHLREDTKDMFVAGTNTTIATLTCIAPTPEAGAAIEAEVQEFLNAPLTLYLVPPWAPEDPRSPAEREQHRRARRAFARAIETRSYRYKDPKLGALQDEILAAAKGDQAKFNELEQTYHKLAAEVDRTALAALRATTDTGTEREVIDLYSEYAAATNHEPLLASSPIGKLLGQWPVEGDKPVGGKERYSSAFGAVSRNGWLVSFTSIAFVNVAEGAPSLVKWLCSKGCIDIKYQFFGRPHFEEGDFEGTELPESD